MTFTVYQFLFSAIHALINPYIVVIQLLQQYPKLMFLEGVNKGVYVR